MTNKPANSTADNQNSMTSNPPNRTPLLIFALFVLAAMCVAVAHVNANEWTQFESISDGAQNGISYSQKIHQISPNDPKGVEVFWKLKSSYTQAVSVVITFKLRNGKEEKCEAKLPPNEEKSNGGWWTSSPIASATARIVADSTPGSTRNQQGPTSYDFTGSNSGPAASKFAGKWTISNVNGSKTFEIVVTGTRAKWILNPTNISEGTISGNQFHFTRDMKMVSPDGKPIDVHLHQDGLAILSADGDTLQLTNRLTPIDESGHEVVATAEANGEHLGGTTVSILHRQK